MILKNDSVGVNYSLVTLDNGTNINCLLYADDTVIMSLSEEGLQKCLDELNKFCKEWKLTISMKKTKCITFQKQNKVDKRSSFFTDGKVVQNVSEFTYLGVNIKSNGSFQSTLKNLSCKASTNIRASAYQIWELNFTLCTFWPSIRLCPMAAAL